MSQPRRQQVIDPDKLQSLNRASDARGLLRLAQQLFALGACGVLSVWLPSPLAWIAYGCYSLLLTFSFCPAHESIHGSAFQSNRLNAATAFVCGLILVLPPRYFQCFHMAHHRHTQIQGRDPELLTVKPTTFSGYLLHISGMPYWLAQIRALLGNALGNTADFVPLRRRRGVINEARLFLVLYAGIAAMSMVSQSSLIWWIWILPVLIGQPFLRLFLLAEHTGCPEVKGMFENTRTTYTTSLMTWFCWNMNYHTAHHAWPGIPFWRLDTITRQITSHLEQTAPGYIAVNRQIASRLA